MDKLKTIFLCATVEMILIVCVGAANIYPNPLNYFLFYNILYGIVFSFVLPLFLLRKEENPFDFIGVKAVGKKQITVLSIFVVFSVGGQLIPIVVNGGIIPWKLLPVGVGFAVAYKLSGNNLIVAYFVNLPNAFVTYMLKYEQFPVMELSSTIAGIVTLCIITAVLFIVLSR